MCVRHLIPFPLVSIVNKQTLGVIVQVTMSSAEDDVRNFARERQKEKARERKRGGERRVEGGRARQRDRERSRDKKTERSRVKDVHTMLFLIGRLHFDVEVKPQQSNKQNIDSGVLAII